MAEPTTAGVSTKEHERSPAPDIFGLQPEEMLWIAHQPFFESRGYELRPRYRPGWVKSWTRAPGITTEDGITPEMPVLKVMDATRKSDGRIVVLKRTDKQLRSEEIEITRYLSQEDFLSDERNHCVPLLDVLDPGEGKEVFLVLPLLRHFDDPELESIEDAVDFVKQTLEGLIFMHEKGVAHRDCARFNIMMDAKDIYPEGYHPQRDFLTLDASRDALVRHRYQVPFPKYYLIDFGISKRFMEGQGHTAEGTDGQDKTVPELTSFKYDPFPVDIYIMGNVYKNELLSKYRGLLFLVPLVNRMTSTEPTDRPSAVEALELFQSCQKRVFSLNLYRRLTPAKQNLVVGLIREGWFLGRRVTSRRRSA